MFNAASSVARAHDIKASGRIVVICSWCGKTRTADDIWRETGDSMLDDKRVKVSHGICPHCFRDVSWMLARW
jgi:hypothetical protein